MKSLQTKGKCVQRCLFDRSNGVGSCGAVLNTATASLEPRQQVHCLQRSNINRRRFHQQKQAIKQLRSQTNSPLFSASNSPEIVDMASQFSALFREIKRLGRGIVNHTVNDDGLVMCSNCYYYTKIGESCWHCGNNC